MTKSKKSKGAEGGVSINSRNIKVGGDIIGRDKTITTNYGIEGKDFAELSEMFSDIKKKIEKRPPDKNVEKDEIKNIVEQIEKEVKKGNTANPSKVERWLMFLAEMAEDIFDLTITILTNPLAGIAKAIRLIANKAKEEKRSTRI